MKNSYLLRILGTVLYFIITSAILLFPAFLNRYPLFFQDSGSYITSAYVLIQPEDRPIGYGLLIWALNKNFWLVIYVQAVITNALLYLVIMKILGRTAYFIHFVSLIILSSTSSLAWFVSQLMPDFLTPVTILSIYLFLDREMKTFLEAMFIMSLIFISNISQYSNLPLSITMIFLHLIITQAKIVKHIVLIVVVFLSILFVKGHLTSMQRISGIPLPVYLMARLSETPILEKYLSENCLNSEMSLCASKDRLPRDSQEFLWGKNSFINMGYTWETSNKEFSLIERKIFSSSNNWGVFATVVLKDLFKQISRYNNGYGLVSLGSESSPYQAINNFAPEKLNNYRQSAQYANILQFDVLNTIQNLLVIFSIAFIIIFLCIAARLSIFPKHAVIFNYYIIAGYVINGLIAVVFSTVYERLQSRVVWLIIFLAVVDFSILISKLQLSKYPWGKSGEI